MYHVNVQGIDKCMINVHCYYCYPRGDLKTCAVVILPATLRNIPTLSQFKSHLKTFICPGFPAESSTCLKEKVCPCVAVECRWMYMNREGGGRGREHERSRRDC